MNLWIIVVSLTLWVQMATSANFIQKLDSHALLPSSDHAKESSVPGACATVSPKNTSSSTQLKERKYQQPKTQIPQEFLPRIVNGMDAAPNEFPYQAQITSDGQHHCGGIILNEIYILTAAHCFTTRGGVLITDYRFFKVVAGEHNIEEQEGPEQVRNIKGVTVHEAYDFNTYYNDIALVRLENSLVLNKNVHPAIFPEPNCDSTGLEATVTGWGDLTYEGVAPAILQKAIVPIISNQDCAKAYGKIQDSAFPDTALCAGNSQGDKDACSGDSGGPLAVHLDNGSYLVVGIVSYGHGCADAQYPGVYTKLSNSIYWINSHELLTSTTHTPDNQEA